MRMLQWMRLGIAVLAAAIGGSAAKAQPGHAPFIYAPFEIDDFERALAPAGIAGATILNPGASPALSHRAVVANGNAPTPYVTGAPLFLEESHAALAPFGGILGTTDGGAPTANNYNDLFPGGWSVSPGGYPNGGNTRNFPSALPSYNGTKISLVTKNDANTSDDVGITSGSQALRVSMWNVGQGDGNTGFDRPVMISIKANDFWGVDDTRFDTFQTVRANPGEYNVSVDVTLLADEMPNTCACDTVAPGYYARLGFISGHGGLFDESPANVLQGPESLLFSNGDEDGDDLVNFTDPDYVDPGNTPGLPGLGVPGVIQRRYVFPASAMSFPANPLADPPTASLRDATGGAADAFMFGFVWNSNYTLTVPTTADGVADGTFSDPQSFVQTHGSFIIDNIKFIPRNPITSADFNNDGQLTQADWQILMMNMNATTAKTFAQGDIGSLVNEATVSPGVVDFQDFIRFEEIWDANNGGAGAFKQFRASVPEPSSGLLFVLGGTAIWFRRRRPSRQLAALALAVGALSVSSASAQLTDTLLFSFENGSFPDALQRWDSNTVADDTVQPPDANTDPDDVVLLATSAVGATNGTQSLKITQQIPTTSGTFINGAFVSIFGSQSGLPDQADAFNAALDVGANNYVIEMDVTYRDADIPPAGYVALSLGLSAGSVTSDTVSNLAIAGDGGGGIADQTIHVEVPLSIDPVDVNDTVLSLPTQASLAGSYNITVGVDGDWGTGNASIYIDNVRLRQVTQPPLLTLEINQTTGLATIKNTPGASSGTGDIVFDYYEVRSQFPEQAADFNDDGTVNAADYTVWRDNLGLTGTATQADGDANGDDNVTAADYDAWKAAFGLVAGGNGTSLNPGGWNSLDDQNVDGGTILTGWVESGSPSSTILSEAILNGSSTWTNGESLPIGNIFLPGSARNLVFRYREPSRRDFLRTGIVTYVGGPAAGSASVVPEPSTFMLVSIVWMAVASVSRRVSQHLARCYSLHLCPLFALGSLREESTAGCR